MACLTAGVSQPFLEQQRVPMILVMGTTGSGKSTLIRNATGDATVVIGSGLSSVTQEYSTHRASINGFEVDLIDTPGFDDTFRTDADILREMASKLAAAHSADLSLAGIIYCHPIHYVRFSGSMRRTFRLFQKLVGTESFHSIVLVTTFWDREDPAAAELRYKALGEDDWKDMIRRGSRIEKSYGTTADASRIVENVIRAQKSVTLDVQAQMVDGNRRFEDTSVGEHLVAEVSRLKMSHDDSMQKLREELKTVNQSWERDQLTSTQEVEALRKRLENVQNQYRQEQQEIEALTQENASLQELQRAHQLQMDQTRQMFMARLDFLEDQVSEPPPPYPSR